ncbi:MULTISPECIES: DUF1493 family protein [Enterobacteriaceae]|uniref:DUF1493 family protein n=1 Tax=Enterobacteriaceae TaxID=543 RepID=UPI000272AE0C|nr:DUF1493 family protein [Enterobacter sp. Ag1]EJF31676.1 hypothetical protein A936_08788 [Enterobacter sp. Ag1]
MIELERAVLQFVKTELGDSSIEVSSSLSTGKHQTVPEDILDMMDKYSAKFNVDCSNIHWRRYFPQTVLPFLPNCILPERLKSDRHNPELFTIGMMIESAKAGRWLYD